MTRTRFSYSAYERYISVGKLMRNPRTVRSHRLHQAYIEHIHDAADELGINLRGNSRWKDLPTSWDDLWVRKSFPKNSLGVQLKPVYRWRVNQVWFYLATEPAKRIRKTFCGWELTARRPIDRLSKHLYGKVVYSRVTDEGYCYTIDTTWLPRGWFICDGKTYELADLA